MLDTHLIDQLRQHFASLESEFELQLTQGSSPRHTEAWEMLSGLASASTKIQIRQVGHSPEPQISLFKNGTDTKIRFDGVPGGHEFSSLVLALLNADGKGRLPDAGIQQRTRNLQGPIHLRTFVSLDCHNCPEVVQALNQMALLHPDFSHQMVDGAWAQDEITALGIQGVPSVVAQGSLIHAGKADYGQLLDALEKHYGTQSQSQITTHEPYDVLVLGGGPAGAAAAVYSARKGLRVGVIARKIGGQVNDTKGIENQISVLYTEGPQLAAQLRTHMEHYQVDLFENREVDTLVPKATVPSVQAQALGLTADADETMHRVLIQSGEVFAARQIIVATGARWRELGVPGEKDYLGAGVHFCPHCDGPFYKGKRVAVVGGGNSGIEAAIDLAGLAQEVTVLEFMDSLRADQVLLDKAQSLPNVRILSSVRTAQVLGDGRKVSGLQYEDRKTQALHTLDLEGIFVQIGLAPNSTALQGILDLSPRGEIEIDGHNRTSVPGIYAAGDVTTTPYKQIIISMGEGAKASLAAFEDRMRA